MKPMTFKAVVAGLGILVIAGMATGRGTAAAAQGKTQWDGVYSDAQAKRGSEIYDKNCSGCHGPALEGKNDAPSLTGAEFGAAWNELSLKDLFERMQKTMPKQTPGSLAAAQYAEVLAFVLQKNGAPAGSADLPSEASGLTAVMFKSTK
jgi:mono/diheme cytochrome c family protein